MVDSGQKIHTDYGSLSGDTADYRAMIEPEWSRPPQADITAYWERTGNHFDFIVSVTNWSGVELSSTRNDAEVTALVYEDVTPDPPVIEGVTTTFLHTNRYVRRLVHLPLNTPLQHGETRRIKLSTPDLYDMTGQRPIDWNKLHGLAFVDYRPDGKYSGKYDMLQAAPAVTAPVPQEMTVNRQSLVFLDDMTKPGHPTDTISVSGFPSTMTWTASSNKSWLKVSPAVGGLANRITASIDIKGMTAGEYTGEILVNAVMPDPKLQQKVPVRLVVLESLEYYWMPIIGGPVPTPQPELTP